MTDRGEQFRSRGFRRWCRRRGTTQRFGAVGEHGSIAVIERFIRTMKQECTRKLLVPCDRRSLQRDIALYIDWYNNHRPHSFLEACTPDEVYYGRPRAQHPALSRDGPGRGALPVLRLKPRFAVDPDGA